MINENVLLRSASAVYWMRDYGRTLNFLAKSEILRKLSRLRLYKAMARQEKGGEKDVGSDSFHNCRFNCGLGRRPDNEGQGLGSLGRHRCGNLGSPGWRLPFQAAGRGNRGVLGINNNGNYRRGNPFVYYWLDKKAG